jgi:hypothetical protein
MPTVTETLRVAGATVTLSLTARGGFVAPEYYVLGFIDFSGQELYIAGWASKDKKILNSFVVPEVLPLLNPDGSPVLKDDKAVFYKNPESDLHTLTCKDCCFPHLFIDKPYYEWVNIAKDKSLIKQKGTPRDCSKRCNFG